MPEAQPAPASPSAGLEADSLRARKRIPWAVIVVIALAAPAATWRIRMAALAACQEPDASLGVWSWGVTFSMVLGAMLLVGLCLLARLAPGRGTQAWLVIMLIVGFVLVALVLSAPDWEPLVIQPGCDGHAPGWWPLWLPGRG
ncbi:hypothetical protein [Nocardioides panzhihuensis]|uniref:Uncharacterized protein n=1 Tax=Nocardioides panzhihuensis TaxID=860243 RepID=A0A7Z0DJE2_9ACTN|nr:hypothetical protein [Nocardioides panzhihuensis]NYI76598.1 hypothetical protein [Nocardioides panzhihuensis]